MSSYDKYDEYKFLVEDTARFTDRRQNVSTLYTSVNSIFLAAVSFIVKDLNLLNGYAAIASLVIIVAGISACASWISYIRGYKKLINLRFTVLKEIEQTAEMRESVKIYAREDKMYYERDDGKGLFSRIEQDLPKIFIGLYVVAIVAIIFALSAGNL